MNNLLWLFYSLMIMHLIYLLALQYRGPNEAFSNFFVKSIFSVNIFTVGQTFHKLLKAL